MHRKYTKTGLRILAAEDGSVLITDSQFKTGTKMSFHLNAEMIERAQDSEREAALMFRQLAAFLKKHHVLTHQ